MEYVKNEKYLISMNDGNSYAICKFINKMDDIYTFRVINPTSDEKSQYNITERTGRIIYIDDFDLNNTIYVDALN
jgi:hypothetical protein